MRYIIATVIALSLTSCAVSTKLIGYGGNPPPNMKSIHMATNHKGYTQEDYAKHPDRDCNGTFSIAVDTKPKYEVDEALEPYLNEFVALAKENGIDLSYIYDENITIEFLETNIGGKAASAPSWERRKSGILIKVRKPTFYNRTEEGRKFVMWHEFGHDILNIPHQNKGMMKGSDYYGLFKSYREGANGYYSKENQERVLLIMLKDMFNLYKSL